MFSLASSYLTEMEWLTSTTPVDMLRFLYGRVSDRKLRLFVCALFRGLARSTDSSTTWEAIAVAEKYVDRQAPLRLLHQANHAVLQATQRGRGTSLQLAAAATAPLDVARLQEVTAGAAYVESASLAEISSTWLECRRGQCALLREIVGNLFRPVLVEQAWKSWASGFVVRVARTIYDEHRFDEVPQLASALRQAGCRDDVVLSHVDSPGPHVRGCWLLDRLLDKE